MKSTRVFVHEAPGAAEYNSVGQNKGQSLFFKQWNNWTGKSYIFLRRNWLDGQYHEEHFSKFQLQYPNCWHLPVGDKDPRALFIIRWKVAGAFCNIVRILACWCNEWSNVAFHYAHLIKIKNPPYKEVDKTLALLFFLQKSVQGCIGMTN